MNPWPGAATNFDSVWDQGHVIVTAPAEEPVTLAEAKSFCFVEHSSDDAMLTKFIASGRKKAENWTGRALVTQTRRMVLDDFPTSDGSIRLPFPPLQSISSVQYYDADDVLQTVASTEYTADTTREPGWLIPAWDAEWPTTYDRANAVLINFVCGYGAASAVPEPIQEAILCWVKYRYDNREGERLLKAFYDLLTDYRVFI